MLVIQLVLKLVDMELMSSVLFADGTLIYNNASYSIK